MHTREAVIPATFTLKLFFDGFGHYLTGETASVDALTKEIAALDTSDSANGTGGKNLVQEIRCTLRITRTMVLEAKHIKPCLYLMGVVGSNLMLVNRFDYCSEGREKIEMPTPQSSILIRITYIL